MHRVLRDCPVARSLHEVVASGRPFVWLPGELPFFAEDSNSLTVHCSGTKHVADRLDEGVPIFKQVIQYDVHSPFAAAAVEEPPPAVVPEIADLGSGAEGDSEPGEEEPKDKCARLLKESASIEHMRLHIPKNPACEICQRSRMYKKRTSSKRYDPLHSRGDLEAVTDFGERLACDFIIVSKARTEGRNNVVLIVRDEHSGYIRAFPCGTKASETINKHLLSFLGPSYQKVPSIMVKSDQAKEFLASCSQLGFQHEPTLENRFPHNTQLEREIRTVEEITRALHLQSGFHMFQDLWSLSVTHAALMVSCFHAKPGAETSRYELATGIKWDARDLLLGQLIYIRDFNQQKFGANAKPAIFAGYRIDTGPKYKDVYLALDYKALQDRTPGYNVPTSVPVEEVFVPEGAPVLPLATAAHTALAEFGAMNLDKIPHLDVPFSSLEPTAPPRERHEYITLDRLIKYGATPGCGACSRAGGTHTAVCKARFTGLIRADKVATGSKTPKTPGTPSGADLPPTPAVETEIDAAVAEEGRITGDGVIGPATLPFCAGVDLAHPEFGLIGRINQDVDAEFLECNINRRKARRRCETAGRNFLYEYACSDDSIIGQVAEQIGVKCVRLTRKLLDLEKAEDVQQAGGQLEEVPGADVWVSITCAHFSPLQHLNEAVHGATFAKKLKKAQSKSIKMLLLAVPFLEIAQQW